VEDSISGLIAGRAAGALTLAVCTSTERIRLVEGGKPDFIVNDLATFVSIYPPCLKMFNQPFLCDSVSVDVVDGKFQVTIDQ
jgi:TRAP-type C4-dicarboxylate transport system substrate-binding protein